MAGGLKRHERSAEHQYRGCRRERPAPVPGKVCYREAGSAGSGRSIGCATISNASSKDSSERIRGGRNPHFADLRTGTANPQTGVNSRQEADELVVSEGSADWVSTQAIMRHLGIRLVSADEWLRTFENSAGVRKGRPRVARNHEDSAGSPLVRSGLIGSHQGPRKKYKRKRERDRPSGRQGL